MGFRNTVTIGSTNPPIAMHFGNDEIIRLMQINGTNKLELQASFEVSATDQIGLAEAVSCFRSRQTVICVPSSETLLTHIRVDCNATDEEVVEKLRDRNEAWKHASIRQLPLYTNIREGSNTKLQQELLCVGVQQGVIDTCVSIAESVKMNVKNVTVPVHATLRAFDRLYRRDGDDAMTSMVIDMDEKQSIAMIAHGMNLVVARALQYKTTATSKKQWNSAPALVPAGGKSNEFERRSEIAPRGLAEPNHQKKQTATSEEGAFVEELRGCLRHHSSLFPDRAIERVVFSGIGALQAGVCASVATDLGIEGFIADPSAWIRGAEELASGPAWTTVAGLCLASSSKGKSS